MNPVDIIFGLLLGLAILRGYSKGLLGTAAGYVAPVLAFVVAADFSAPARERLAAAVELPDLALDILAPVLVFLVVVLAVRFFAAAVARSLGVGLSMTGRLVAATASLLVTALALGALVVLAHEMRPERRPYFFDQKDGASGEEVIVRPVEDLLVDVDDTFNESVLGPPLGDFTAAVVGRAFGRAEGEPLIDPDDFEAAARKAADAAVDAVGQATSPNRNPMAPKKPDDGSRR